MDDDGIYSSTFVAGSMAESLDHLTRDVLKTRERHGGHNWTPTAGWPTREARHG